MNYRARAGLIYNARALYALNWMDIAPALKYIKSSFDIDLIALGALVTSFYLGIAIFQVVGGSLASYMGDKKTSLTGLLLMGIFAIMSGLSTNFTELIISRFFSGLSAAFFFSSTLSLLISVIPENKSPFHIGVYNGAFAAGGGIGIFGWAILDQYIGYKIPFIIAGIITLATFILIGILFKGVKNIKTDRAALKKGLKHVLTSKVIIFIALIGIGARISETIIGQFFVYYLESIRVSPSSAGLVSSIYLLVGFLGGILGGYHFSRTRHKIAMFVIINLMLSFLLISLGFVHNYIIIVFITITLGMLTIYGFSVMYTFIRYISRRDLVSLSLSFNNSIQLAIAAISPIIFTGIAYGYSNRVSWIVTSILPLVTLSLILFIKNGLKNSIPEFN
jgi:ACDE family multidrug resistance protein